MKRLKEDELVAWKQAQRRKPLIIRGARQVGKSWLADNLGRNFFQKYVKVDLERRRDLHALFDGNLDPKHILNMLALESGKIEPGNTLLFFDEIQACPRAVTALRYFYEEIPELHVLAAGSLLEFVLQEVSIPVGRVQYLHLTPMTFYEYLLATKSETSLAEHALRHPVDVPAEIQRRLLEELRRFLFVGGMPEAVQVYAETGSLVDVFAVQSEIIASYRDDFLKYTPHVDPVCLDTVLLNAAQQIGNQTKYTKLGKSHTGPTNKRALELLVKAKVIHKVTAATPVGVPLGARVNLARFKTILMDVGILQRLVRLNAELEIKQADLLDVYRGRLAEQFVAQELIAIQGEPLYYWSREVQGSSAEVDFLTVVNGRVFPVEVKSGKGGSLRSLHLMLKEYPDCPTGLVLYDGVYGENKAQRLQFLPLYAAAVLSEH